MKEYLEIWIKYYYQPGTKLTDPCDIENVTNAVIKYKRVLHNNDPAYKIFSKEWGKPVADAFFHIETRDHPSITPPDHTNNKIIPWDNKDLNALWERPAQEQVMRAPEQVQRRIAAAIEARASADGLGIITLEVFEKYKETILGEGAK